RRTSAASSPSSPCATACSWSSSRSSTAWRSPTDPARIILAMYEDASLGRRVRWGPARSVEDMEITTTDLGLAARVQHLTKSFGAGEGAVRALDDVSVGIRAGQFTAIMGPSGSGKST